MSGDGMRQEFLLREAVLAGSEDAWRAWYDATYAPLEAYVLWRCARLRGLADDVLQETWLIAVRTIRRFRPEAGDFLAWLRGIAANVIRNQIRQWQRHLRRHVPLAAEPSCNGTVAGDDQRQRAEDVVRALAALPEHYEAALRDKYLERLSVEAMAVARGESPKAVESLLTRARAAFREAYLKRE
jgi:RNA polymerase sigma-70 factor (ECF subfamily)